MNVDDLRPWLIENGGPSVLIGLGAGNAEAHAGKLMAIEKVRSILDYLDGFDTEARDKKTLEHLIHYYKDSAIENFFPLLIHYGFGSGMDALDNRIGPLRRVFQYLRESDFYFTNHGFHLFIHQFFFMAGCKFPEVTSSFIKRLKKLHTTAVEMRFDIFHDGTGFPRIPAAFEGRRMIKPEMNPFSADAAFPLPTIYDLRAMAFLSNIRKRKQEQRMIEDLLTYIMRPEFQKIPEGYGVVWSEKVRRYHACGWSPTLPLYRDFERPGRYNIRRLLYYLETMARFDSAKSSDWYKCCVNHLRQYETDRGTYLLPDEYMTRKYVPEAFLSDRNLALKSHEKRAKLKEVLSTWFIYRLL